MRKYECVLLLRTGLAPTDADAIFKRFEDTVKRHDGEITLTDRWGTRPLAYPIEKQTSGDYTLFRFKSNPGALTEADRDMRLDDRVLRHLIVVDEEWEERNRTAMAKRRAARGEEEEEAARA